MDPWNRQVQQLVEQIDQCIRQNQSEDLTLTLLARQLGYSEYHLSRKFREISGMSFRDYLSRRRLALSVRRLRETDDSILSIALDYGFSSHAAYTRAFRASYGISPRQYRRTPVPLVLQTQLHPFDCYLLDTGGTVMYPKNPTVASYFVTIPPHKFLHIRNYESIGYWDFWQKQAKIPGQDCETVCGILDSIPQKLDDSGGTEADSSSGQIMAFLNDPAGRICSWGIPLAECYGVRLPMDYSGPVPDNMYLMDVPAGEYLVFEHGPFDFETENAAVEAAMEAAMRDFDYAASGYCLDTTPGRLFYFYHDCTRFWKYIRPVKKLDPGK